MTPPGLPSAPDSNASDFVRELVISDNAAGTFGGRVQTRFPPEPNGYLHIGHAKAVCIDFGIAAEFGGRCNLRLDDTTPAPADAEYDEAIIAEERRLGPQHEGQRGPHAHQHDLAADVVAHLDGLLVRIAGLVDMVVAARLEKEVAGQTRCHRHTPGENGGQGRVDEQQAIGHDEAHRTQQVQGLIDAAVVVVAGVVPALDGEFLQKAFQGSPLGVGSDAFPESTGSRGCSGPSMKSR